MQVSIKQWKKGSCHCGQVAFEVYSDFQKAYRCNCSICNKKAFLHLIVEAHEFKLFTPESNLGLYQFGTKTARHLFCKQCGISSFYVPRSHPNGYSINVRCLDDFDLDQITLEDFDGKNWEKSIGSIR